MGETIKQTSSEAVRRWHEKMPKFFRWLMTLAIGVITTASAIHFGAPALGAEHSEWWSEVYKYIISSSIGVAAVCKFTVDGGFREKQSDKISNTILDKDDN